MSYIQVGNIVRIYHADDCFDEGVVTDTLDERITVDFYDWIERWEESEFALRELFLEGMEVLVPSSRGKIMIDFRAQP